MTASTDGACVRALLKQAVEMESMNMTTQEKADLERLCEESAGMALKLHAWDGSVEEEANPSAPAEMDWQILQLYQQVTAGNERVSRLRQDVPLELREAMHAELIQCRPEELVAVAAAVEAAAAAAAAGSTAGAAENLAAQQGNSTPAAAAAATEERCSAAADAAVVEASASNAGAAVAAAEEGAALDTAPDLDAWKQLDEMTKKVPALMARLDQTLGRLTRVIDITEADQRRPSPRTVERALLGRPVVTEFGGEGALDESAMMQAESEIGAATTRKLLAYELAV